MTSGSTGPTPADDSVPRSPAESHRRTGWLAWVATPLVVLLVGGALDAVDQSAPEVAGGYAARYVPPDGHRSVSIDLTGATTVAEASRTVGVEGVLAAPTTVAAGLLAEAGVDEIAQAQWWRSSYVNDRGERGSDLFQLSDEGVTQVASWGGSVGFVFDPPLVLLPATVQPGDTWSSTGDALPGGGLTYSSTATARPVEGPFTDPDGREIPLTGGCIGSESEVVIANADASLSTTVVRSAVWCPGRAVVWSSGTIDGESIGTFELRPEVLDIAPTDAAPTSRWPAMLDDASRLLPGRTLPLQTTDPFFGESEISGRYPLPASATADGRLVTVNDQGDDVQVWNLDRTDASLAWLGHPGGTVVSVGVVGDRVVSGTAQRRVVAYDRDGRRVWSWGADELVLAPPVAAGEASAAGGAGADDVIVAARSGTVTRLDAARGTPRWSQSLGADARSPVVVASGRAVVADERERLTAIDVATGSIVWQSEVGIVARMTADAESGVVVAVLQSGSLVALDLQSGDEVWRAPMPGIPIDLIVVADRVVAMADDATVAFDSQTGRVAWRADSGVALVGDSTSSVVTLVRDRSVELRSSQSGDLIDEQLIEAAAASASVSVLAVGDALVILESNGVLRRWELRDARVGQ